MKYIKVFDIILLIVLLAIIFLFYSRNVGTDKTIITINTHDKSYRYALNKDMMLEIEGLHGQSIIEIKDGHVRFLSSPCPDKLCIKDGVLQNKPLICMVNAVIVRYALNQSTKDIQIDSIGY